MMMTIFCTTLFYEMFKCRECKIYWKLYSLLNRLHFVWALNWNTKKNYIRIMSLINFQSIESKERRFLCHQGKKRLNGNHAIEFITIMSCCLSCGCLVHGLLFCDNQNCSKYLKMMNNAVEKKTRRFAENRRKNHELRNFNRSHSDPFHLLYKISMRFC